MALGRFGLDEYGGVRGAGFWGGVTALSLVQAYPLGPRSIYVRFNVEPMTASPVTVGDCQNWRSWDLTRADTNARMEVVGAVRLRTPEERRLILLTAMGPSSVMHTLNGMRLRSAGGLPAAPPTFIAFRGVDVSNPAFGPASRKPIVVDLKNREFFGQGQALGAEANGNYGVESGPEGFKKRILRICTTKPGEHPADASFGVPVTLGELLTDPAGMQKAIHEQIVRDPETDAASVRVEGTALGIAYVIVRARMKNGATSEATIAVDDAGIRLA